jgi:hypothetical protein
VSAINKTARSTRSTRLPTLYRKTRNFPIGLKHRVNRVERAKSPEPEWNPRQIKKCVICGVRYKGWLHSEYCSDKCVSEGHRKWIREGKNPSKARVKSLREQFRHSWERIKARGEPESFETWLWNFEKRIEWMRLQAAQQISPSEQTNHTL